MGIGEKSAFAVRVAQIKYGFKFFSHIPGIEMDAGFPACGIPQVVFVQANCKIIHIQNICGYTVIAIILIGKPAVEKEFFLSLK
ncbi:hypothetical protein D3C85_1032650 [compost metagenome]